MTGLPRLIGATLTAGLLTLAACGDDANDHSLQQRRAVERAEQLRADTEATSSTVPSPTVTAVEPTGVVIPVQAIDNTFRPQVVEVSVGDEVFWENRGLNDHDVLYVDGDDWGIEVEGFGPGAAYAHIFTEPGEYRYYCSIHGNETVGMTGTVIVKP